ncbi:mediator of RNA polymerase II transcription subunit 20-like [Tropilaelaps mercedesae]|uniref:Mediator of RNA polymerase II transcription subunit 20 n=1 Tax=Tropilaelaps mercedesae TaxID=418985 RepID=A0A1V9WZ57_9ACAR|nr:mediator of RNA polymerase II transcription subunit 20-like [Tropilaelaps mercedesae]
MLGLRKRLEKMKLDRVGTRKRQVLPSMGVVSVHMVPCAGPEALQSTAEAVCRLVERQGGRRDGGFCVDCETFLNVPSGRPMHVLHDSEHPASVFSLLESRLCLVADSNFDALMNKLSPQLYSTKIGTKVECKGPRYQTGDFLVKVGTVTVGTSARGVLVECEYQPCAVPASCWDLIRELLEPILGVSLPQPNQYLAPRMNELYAPVDTIQQYMEHFNVLRRTNQGGPTTGTQQQQQQQQAQQSQQQQSSGGTPGQPTQQTSQASSNSQPQQQTQQTQQQTAAIKT